MKTTLFQRPLASQRRFGPFLDGVRGDFQVRPERPRRFRRSYFDTFDWRLYAADRTLEVDEFAEPRARLCGIGASGPLLEEPIHDVPAWFRGYPGRALRPELSRLGRQRALLRLGTVEVRASPYEIRDRRGKILAHLVKEQVLAGNGAGRGRTVAATVRVLPLRGYERVAERMLGRLDAPADRDQGAFAAVMRVLHRQPGDYSGRLRVQLSPTQTARQALATVLLFLLDVAERNLDGIESDADAEFLHDLRISCRRSRSLLTQVRGVLPPADLARFRDAFSWLSTLTGPRRDLDVFLLALPEYAAELDEAERRALQPLRDLLETARAREHERLLAELHSERFLGFRRDWRAFLAAAADDGTENGGGPVLAASSAAIRRVYRRLLREGRSAGAGDYSEALHELRKTGKKLRYLLEAFRTLYPERDIEGVIAALRKLQNVLGDIVDSAVQLSGLREWTATLAARGTVPPATANALAALAAAREAAGRAAERKFHARFAAFASRDTAACMRRLFGGR